jgi:F-box and leucine-rich repeat protein GRR1
MPSISVYADFDESLSFHEDMIQITDRLPSEDEYRRVRHLLLPRPSNPLITDDALTKVFYSCPHLQTVVLSGVPNVTDRSIVALAEKANNLQKVNLTGCDQVTDVGVLELASKSLPLQTLQLNGVTGITDPSVSAIAKACSRLVELELCDLPLISPLSIRDVWSYSR